MSEKQAGGIRPSQVVAGALAAVTAAFLGATLGVAGTVLGAGIASIVTTVGSAIYLRSIQRTRRSVRTVRERVVTRSGRQLGERASGDPAEDIADDPVEDAGADQDTVDDDTDPTRPARRQPSWAAVAGATVLAFVLGMLLITGVEWARGGPLSGGDGTTLGEFIRSQPAKDGRQPGTGTSPSESSGPTTPSTETETTTVTVTQPPATSTTSRPEQDETTTTPPTTTTTTEPTTTTDDPSQPPPADGVGQDVPQANH